MAEHRLTHCSPTSSPVAHEQILRMHGGDLASYLSPPAGRVCSLHSMHAAEVDRGARVAVDAERAVLQRACIRRLFNRRLDDVLISCCRCRAGRPPARLHKVVIHQKVVVSSERV